MARNIFLSWVHTFLQSQIIKSQSNREHGLKVVAMDQLADRMAELVSNTKASYEQIVTSFNSYHTMYSEFLIFGFEKDEMGIIKKVNRKLLFTHSQTIREIYVYRFQVLGFIVILLFEVIIYFQLSDYLFHIILVEISRLFHKEVVGLNLAVKIVGSTFFAVAPAFLVAFATAYVLNYLKGRHHYKNGRIESPDFQKRIVYLTIGVVTIALTILFLIYINLHRSYALDSGSSSFLVYGLICVSTACGIGLGFKIKDNLDLRVSKELYKKWESIKSQLASCYQSMTSNKITLMANREEIRWKSYSLLVDNQRLMKREIDERDKDLYKQFHAAVLKGDFHDESGKVSIKPQVSYHYKHLITNESLLHDDFFDNFLYLQNIISDINRMIAEIAALEKKRLEIDEENTEE